MRKLQTGTVPAAEQANAKPVSPEPRKEWPRWKKILAIAAVAGGALALGSCKESKQTVDPRERAVEILEKCLPSNCQSSLYDSYDPYDDPVYLATDEKTTPHLKERIVDILEKIGAIPELAEIAHDIRTSPRLRERIIGILEKSPQIETCIRDCSRSLTGLANIVTFPSEVDIVGSQLRERIVGILERARDYDGLADIAADDRTEPLLRERILRTFETASGLGFRSSFSGLTSLATYEETDAQLRERIINILGRARDFWALASIAKYAGTELQLGERILSILERAGTFSPLIDIAIGEETDVRLRARILNLLERTEGNIYCDGWAGSPSCLTDLSILATDEESGSWLRERIVGILERTYIGNTSDYMRSEALYALQIIATDKKTRFQLKERIVGMLKRADAFAELASIAVCKETEPSIKAQIITLLRRASDDGDESASEQLEWIQENASQ